MSLAHHKLHLIPNGCGWDLELKQCPLPRNVDRKRNPLVIVPGYGMNSFIFSFHPRGLSLEGYLREKGFEVWSVNLRAQGGSRRRGGSCLFGLKDLGAVDLRAAIDAIAEISESRTGKVDVIGCSLGGTIAFIYAALVPKNRLGSLVAIGAPLRWEKIHPLLKAAFFSPRLVGMIPFVKTREIARLLFPLLLRSPLLKIYLHKEMVDLRHLDFLFETIENPNGGLNREIGQWLRTKDLYLDGLNLTHRFRKVKNPLLCVLANDDGIVPPMTALSAHEVAGSRIKETLLVGTDRLRFAHADLFVSDHCHEMVFRPIADWLLKVGGLAAPGGER